MFVLYLYWKNTISVLYVCTFVCIESVLYEYNIVSVICIVQILYCVYIVL
jgi:hypothetical protein